MPGSLNTGIKSRSWYLVILPSIRLYGLDNEMNRYPAICKCRGMFFTLCLGPLSCPVTCCRVVLCGAYN